MKHIGEFPVPEFGDKVLVRHDLQVNHSYCNLHDIREHNVVTDEMYNLRGQYVTIDHVLYNGQYTIDDNDCGGFAWTTGMFDLTEYEITPISVSKDDLMEFLK